jgi:hypothetical protein
VALENPLVEVLSFVEGDVKWWEDAAQHCEELAHKLGGEEQAQLGLLCAVYRERAQSHRDLVARMRERVLKLT